MHLAPSMTLVADLGGKEMVDATGHLIKFRGV